MILNNIINHLEMVVVFLLFNTDVCRLFDQNIDDSYYALNYYIQLKIWIVVTTNLSNILILLV